MGLKSFMKLYLKFSSENLFISSLPLATSFLKVFIPLTVKKHVVTCLRARSQVCGV